MPATISTDTRVSTSLSNRCPAASLLPFPGGRWGVRKIATSVIAIALVTSQITMMRPSGPSRFTNACSRDVEESVHVAERLHRAAEPVEETGGARARSTASGSGRAPASGS